MPAALPWLIAAFAAKMYGTKKQKERYDDIKRGRSRLYADAQKKKDKLTEEALTAARDTSSKFKKKEVDAATAAQEDQLALDFSQLPKNEFAVTAPIRRGEPTVITNAAKTAAANALRDINRYARDSAGITALTEAFGSPDQMNTAMMNRAGISEKARQQRALAEILGLNLNEISDPHSLPAEQANALGDILMMFGMGA